MFEDDADAKIMIMGDFNDYPDNKASKKFYRQRSRKCLFIFNYIIWMYSKHQEGKGTHKHEGSWGVLDQIIVSQFIG